MAGQPADVRPLPLLNRLVYASGSLGGNVFSRSKDLWLIFFYAPPPGADTPERVPILLLGILLTLARIIEALDDPLIGWWSDRTRSRWGRRIPFVVGATPFWVLFAALLWFPPDDHQTVRNAVYFFIVLEAFHLFSTLSGGPFESLLPEVAPLAKDRLSIVTWQVFFGTLGAVVALVGSGVIIDIAGFQAMGVTMAIVALISRYVALAGVWRYARRDVAPVTFPLVRSVLTTFRNSQFVAYLPTFILFNMAISMMTAALPYWVSAVLFRGFAEEIAKVEAGALLRLQLPGFSPGIGEGTATAILTGSAIAVVLLALPAVYALGARRGKAWVYRAAMLAGTLYLPWVAFMGFVPGLNDFAEGMIFAGLVGIPMAAVFTFPNAIQADIIDYDAVLTGQRREAVYYATQATLEKIASSLFPLILALLLTLGSTPDNPLGIRLVGPVAGLACIAGLISFRGYRLPDQVTPESVRAARLEARIAWPRDVRLET